MKKAVVPTLINTFQQPERSELRPFVILRTSTSGALEETNGAGLSAEAKVFTHSFSKGLKGHLLVHSFLSPVA